MTGRFSGDFFEPHQTHKVFFKNIRNQLPHTLYLVFLPREGLEPHEDPQDF